MQITLNAVRRRSGLFAACVLSAMLSGSAALPSQDPQQPDSYNSGTAVPPEKPTKPADVAADRALTQKIRKAIANDKTLSASGRRVKVTAQAGKVTLQGSAASEAERTDIFTKAADAAGGANVTNNIKVTSSPQS